MQKCKYKIGLVFYLLNRLMAYALVKYAVGYIQNIILQRLTGNSCLNNNIKQ